MIFCDSVIALNNSKASPLIPTSLGPPPPANIGIRPPPTNSLHIVKYLLVNSIVPKLKFLPTKSMVGW